MTRARDLADTQDNLGGAVPPITTGKNVIINGGFDFWQRGTTSAAIGYGNFLADRWKVLNNGTGQNTTYSRDTSVPNSGSLYSAKVQQLTSTATGVSEYGLTQIFETLNIYQLCGKTITMSFWYRASTTGSHYARIYSLQTGGTDSTIAFTVNAANTWEYKTITFTSFAAVTAIATADNANGGGVQVGPIVFGSGVNRTVAINEYFQITQVQIEAGSVATPFSRAGGPIQGELAACQRYYYKQELFRMAASFQSPNAVMSANHPVTMRTSPSVTVGMTNANYGTVWQFAQPGRFAITKTGTVLIYADTRPQFWSVTFDAATYSNPPTAFEAQTTAATIEMSAEI
jgi:hypothetical protein